MGKFNTVVINLFGGPGSGKSTAAAGIFYELKKRGYCCELVTEFAKDKVWEDSYNTLNDQIYILGKQYHRLWRTLGKVQFIITDACLVGGIYYNKTPMKYFDDFTIELYNQFENISFFINRGKTFEKTGRVHTEEQSKEIDNALKDIFKKYNLDYQEVEQENAVQSIVNYIVEYYNLILEDD